MNDKLNICKKTRKIASNTLLITLKKLLSSNKPISEVLLRDTWLKELRKHKEIFPDGWYNPPPHGICVVFGNEDAFERINLESMRWEKFWSSDSVFLDKNKGIILAYASPVERESGVMGDFGVTLYLGKNSKIKEYFKNILNSQIQIYNFAKPGISFKKIYNFAETLFKKLEASNDWWINITDKSGRNIGHAIPGISQLWNKKELEIFENGNWKNVCKMIRKKRIFVSPLESFTPKKGDAFTIEHRLKSKLKLPVVYFHTIALFKENGEKELLTDFDKIFKLAGMDYMLS